MTDTHALPPLPDLAQLEKLAKEAKEGPWRVQDSCSYRRIGTEWHDGDVVCPITQRHDGHPDLLATPETLDYIAAAHPGTTLALIAHVRALKAENEQLREAAENLVSRLWLDHPASYDVVNVHALHDLRAATEVSNG